MILRCWSGRAAVAALGWEMPARLGSASSSHPRETRTGHKSLLQDVQQWGIWKCSPLFLPVLLPSFATPEAR